MSRSLAERLTERVHITFEGRQWPVLFTHDVLLDLEESLQVNILNGDLNMFQPSARVLRGVVHRILVRAGAESTLQGVGDLLRPGKLIETHNTLARAWRAAMPEPDPEHKGPREPNKPPSKPATWMEIWADNRYNLGLAEEEWLAMTPRMVQYLNRERLETVRQRELMLSRVGTTAANFGGMAPKDRLPEDVLMLHPYPKAVPDGELSAQDIQAKMSEYFAHFRGRPN